MKSSYLKTEVRVIVVVLLCALLLVQIPMEYSVNAQNYCPPENTPLADTVRGDLIRWSQNAPVQVNVNSGRGQFTRNEFDNCIEPVFDNFNYVNASTAPIYGNSSGVNFSLTFSQSAVATVTAQQISRNEPGIVRGFQINKGDIGINGGITYFGDNGTYLNSATTIISRDVSNCAALRQVLAHEIGHTMGLEHFCGNLQSYCVTPQASIMNQLPCEEVSNTTGDCTRLDYIGLSQIS